MTTHDVEIDETQIRDVPSAPASGMNGLLGALGGTDPIAALLSQIGGGASDNPVLPLISQLLQNRRVAEVEQDTEEDERRAVAEQEALLAREEMQRRMTDLNATIASVYAELEALRQRNDTLAAALGACYLCFGSDPQCDVCRGRGLPGSRRPDVAAFREYVLPATRRVQLQSPAASPSSASAGSQRRPETADAANDTHTSRSRMG